MKTLEQKLISNYRENTVKAKNINPKWIKGDRVRVLKNLDVNVYFVRDFLGKECTVDSVRKHIPIFGSEPRIEYMIKLNGRIEPFWEDELDDRFKSKSAQTK